MPRDVAPTEVCITVDAEFSVGGAFSAPHLYSPVGERAVYCAVNGREHGLGYLLDTFREYDISATFFVEALNHCFFGDEPMRKVASRIRAAGLDVQLHLHPCWLHFRSPSWRSEIANGVPNDSCAGRTLNEMTEIIELGLAAFERWGLPRPIALRTGGFQTDLNVYRAMKRVGIPIGSNVAVATHDLGDPALALCGGRRWIEGVLELPVLTYVDRTDPRALGRGRRRSLQVTASSWAETRALLWSARRKGQSPVVVLTHPFEFVKKADIQYTRMRRNRVNQARLAALCRFLREHCDDFKSVSFAEGMADWLRAGESDDPAYTVPRTASLMRTIENIVNDRVWTF